MERMVWHRGCRQGLSGQERHRVELIAGVVGPYHGFADVDAEILREVPHDGRVVVDDIAAGR